MTSPVARSCPSCLGTRQVILRADSGTYVVARLAVPGEHADECPDCPRCGVCRAEGACVCDRTCHSCMGVWETEVPVCGHHADGTPERRCADCRDDSEGDRSLHDHLRAKDHEGVDSDECGRCGGDGEIGQGRSRQTCPVCRGSGLSSRAEVALWRGEPADGSDVSVEGMS